MDVLVTGGAGFIGANLCGALRDCPDVDRVVVLDDLSSGKIENLESLKDVELVTGSILDERSLARASAGVDAIVHLAARPSVPRSLEDPVATHHANATGTLAVLECARLGSRPHVIVASSSSVYGANPELPKREDMATFPMSPYGASKLATESYTLAHGRSFGMDVLAFRFFNVFGPLQAADHAYAAVIPAFIAAALRGDPLVVHGDGGQTRDFTYVGSVCAVLVDAVRRKVTSDRAVNLAFGSRVSLLELIAILEEVLGAPVRTTHTEPRAGDVRDSQADQTRLRELFPDARPVPLAEGLCKTVDWFRQQTRLANS
ncbi:MAG: NAD-dependent epimerase/dehydratase family protein [Acidimicrobiales bacterium]